MDPVQSLWRFQNLVWNGLIGTEDCPHPHLVIQQNNCTYVLASLAYIGLSTPSQYSKHKFIALIWSSYKVWSPITTGIFDYNQFKSYLHPLHPWRYYHVNPIKPNLFITPSFCLFSSKFGDFSFSFYFLKCFSSNN